MLNHLIMDALQCVPDVLDYLRNVEETKIFQFCAIPQVIAVRTLEKCYNNPSVFYEKVTLRKGLIATLCTVTNMTDVENEFSYVLESIVSQKNEE
jgi:farnesyl-diphosphate farnesyltransferase